MGGSKSGASAAFTEASLRRSDRAFESGFPLLKRGMGMANSAIQQGGEPAYMGAALDASLANAQDVTMMDAQAQQAGLTAQNKGIVAGGNNRQILNPESVGAKMAQLVAQSGAGRQSNRIAQIFEAAGVSLGGSGGAADAQTRAFSNQLGAISMRPAVDPTYAAIVGAANAAGTLYGAGAFGGKAPLTGTGSGQAMGQAASNGWMMGGAGSGWASNPGTNINWGSMPFNTVYGRR